MPQNGVAASRRDRAPFSNAVALFKRLRTRACFEDFVERDLQIWNSGFAPGFLRATAQPGSLVWAAAWLPWGLFVALGRLRAGGDASGFERVTQTRRAAGKRPRRAATERRVSRELALISREPTALPRSNEPQTRSLARETSGASTALAASLREVELGPLRALPGAFPDLVTDDVGTLYYDPTDALCAGTIAALDYLGVKFAAKRVDCNLLEENSRDVRRLTPFGELPAFVAPRSRGARCVYGARLVIEYADALAPSRAETYLAQT